MLQNYPSPIDSAPLGTQMGHREPTNRSVIRSRVVPYTLASLVIQGKEKL
jgi:hypothetical protein